MKSYIKKEKNGGLLPVESTFIITAHHIDIYPKANNNMGPSCYLPNTNFGNDFNKDSAFKMYHGTKIPGFPNHPHRGFETVTLALDGVVDHTDSLGSSGRYASGDVQWMTAGKGIQHAEMFPLMDIENENRFELIQIWLNLPKKNKFVEPFYQMMWRENIPLINITEKSKVKLIAGEYENINALNPNPDSWARDFNNSVKIMLIELAEGDTIKLKGGNKNLFRMLYAYEGNTFSLDGDNHKENSVFKLIYNENITLKSIKSTNKFLLLEGMPINEPIYAYGPFVMNTREEVMEAYKDYNETEFGGWPYPVSDPVHDKKEGRFVKFSDGKIELP